MTFVENGSVEIPPLHVNMRATREVTQPGGCSGRSSETDFPLCMQCALLIGPLWDLKLSGLAVASLMGF